MGGEDENRKNKIHIKENKYCGYLIADIYCADCNCCFYYLFFYMKDQIQDSYLKYLEMYAQIVESKLEETSQNGFGIIIDSKIQDRLSEWILLSGQKNGNGRGQHESFVPPAFDQKDIEQILFNNMALVGQIRHLSIITP